MMMMMMMEISKTEEWRLKFYKSHISCY